MKEKKDINIEIGGRIKMSRESAGLTQDRFAELIGMGTKNVSAIERGAVGVSLSSMQKIYQVLYYLSPAMTSCLGVKPKTTYRLWPHGSSDFPQNNLIL